MPLSEVLWPAHSSPAPRTGTFSHLSVSGPWKPSVLLSACLAALAFLSASPGERQGGRACSGAVHSGANAEHRRNLGSAEHCAFTSG